MLLLHYVPRALASWSDQGGEREEAKILVASMRGGGHARTGPNGGGEDREGGVEDEIVSKEEEFAAELASRGLLTEFCSLKWSSCHDTDVDSIGPRR